MVQSPQPVADPNDAFRLERCQQRLGYQFRDIQLLEAALTHASGADHRLSSNERLEFLGDAILGLVVCEQLFTAVSRPARRRSDQAQVDRRQPADVCQDQPGARAARVPGAGQGNDDASGGAAFGVVRRARVVDRRDLLDGGMEPAREFMLAYFGPEIESAAAGDTGGNYKSLLQQFAQREHGVTPTYHLMDEKGPDHSKCFKMSAQIGRAAVCAGLGPQQEGIGAARRPQRDLRTARRSGALPERRNRAEAPDESRAIKLDSSPELEPTRLNWLRAANRRRSDSRRCARLRRPCGDGRPPASRKLLSARA